jgi:predicted nucleic acid-binding protein
VPPTERVVIDTSAFYALISSTDNFHMQATLAYERLLDWEWELWTTSYILVETSALVQHRLGFEPLRTFMDTLLSGIVNVLWVENLIHREAWRQMVEKQGKGLSLVDWTTVMSAERLKASVFTFDQGFRQQGILVLPR